MFDALDSAVCNAMWAAAEQAILPRFRPGKAIVAKCKSAGEVVTAADRESEAILSEQLARLVPGAAIVGEEYAHCAPEVLSHLGSGTCWIIDPLDGTGNFVEGNSPFGILVALAVDGVPHGGWILDPVSRRLCVARRGFGALIDGQPFTVPTFQEGKRPIVAVTPLFSDAAPRSALIGALAERCSVVDSPRCAADQYPRVATGSHDATLFTRTIAWDHAAGVIFLNEAGGTALRPDGGHYRCDDPDGGLIIGSCPKRWELVASLVAQSGYKLARAHLPTG